MNKREFLKAGAAGVVAAGLASPARTTAIVPKRRIAVVQPTLPGAHAFSQTQNDAGAEVMLPSGDPVRWFRSTLRPALAGAEVHGFTDGVHALLLESSLREEGYVRSGEARRIGRATLWAAAPRS